MADTRGPFISAAVFGMALFQLSACPKEDFDLGFLFETIGWEFGC
jgi:hypothetical protein